jgi:hypothetical protein
MSGPRASVGLALLFFCSCTDSEPRRSYLVEVNPFDVTSGLTSLELDLWVQPSFVRIGELTAVATQTTFATWPDLAPLATRFSDLPMQAQPAFAVVAADPQPDGWYVAIVPALPPGLRISPGAFGVLPDGRAGVRLRVGSQPTLRGVGACPASPPSTDTDIMVSFTESTQAATTSTMPLTVAAGRSGALAPCAGTGPLAGTLAPAFNFTCRTLAAGDVVSISLGAGLRSATGVEAAPFERVVPFTSLVRLDPESSCLAVIWGP